MLESSDNDDDSVSEFSSPASSKSTAHTNNMEFEMSLPCYKAVGFSVTDSCVYITITLSLNPG
jgi:hypothetical protein